MAADPRRALGQDGERAVANALLQRGFCVLERNWRSRYGELDLIASDGVRLWFVEVKTHRGSRPTEVSFRQQDRIVRMAYAFLQHRPLVEKELALVVARVRWKGELAEIDWLEQAFEAAW